MSTITIYPRLYTSRRATGEGVVVSKGDEAVQALHEFLVNRTVNTLRWDYRRQVVDSGVRLFGEFSGWLQDQLNNPRCVGYNLEFLKDTMQFIRTGQRELCLANWIELVAEGDDLANAAQISKTRANNFALGYGESTVKLLQGWCSHPGGIEDLAGTLHILFGRSRHAA
jgi:hypothetical protein